jgi:hypothetical protein
MQAPTIDFTSSQTAAGASTALSFTADSSQLPACQFDPTTLQMGMDILVDSKIDAINPVVEKLMGMLTASCCAYENEFAVETALREALANAIVHGNHCDTRKKVRVCCGCDSTKGILIIVRDEGEGWLRSDQGSEPARGQACCLRARKRHLSHQPVHGRNPF